MTEIERKFLVNSNAYKDEATHKYEIKQGFLNTDKRRTVRVRITDKTCFLTVKGRTSKDGLERFEWETEISKEDAINLLELCEDPVVEKIRYEIKCGPHIFEVDEFTGDNLGLVIAEIELSKKDEKFKIPDWLGQEVTGNILYYNANLITNPYKNWKK